MILFWIKLIKYSRRTKSWQRSEKLKEGIKEITCSTDVGNSRLPSFLEFPLYYYWLTLCLGGRKLHLFEAVLLQLIAGDNRMKASPIGLHHFVMVIKQKSSVISKGVYVKFNITVYFFFNNTFKWLSRETLFVRKLFYL